MKNIFKKITLFIIITLISCGITNIDVLAKEFPNSITNIYELTDLAGTFKGYTGNKREIAFGTGNLGYYLGKQTQFLPYKVGNATENQNGNGISGYNYAVFCTLFGAKSPAKNSYSVLVNGQTAPSSCTIDNSWNIGIQAGVGAIINSVTPSDYRFYGNGLIDYYDAEIAINQFLYEKTNNACHISNGSCGSAAVSISTNDINDPSQKADELINLAKVAYDKADKLTNTKMNVSFPVNKQLEYSDNEEIWKSEHITVQNIDKYGYNSQKFEAVLKNKNGKIYENYAYITNTNTPGTFQIGVCNNNDVNDYCKKINNFESLDAGKYTVAITIGGKESFPIAQNYSCGSNYQSITPAFTNTKVVEENFNEIFTFEVEEETEDRTFKFTLLKVDEEEKTISGSKFNVYYGNTKKEINSLLESGFVSNYIEIGRKVCIEEIEAPKGYKKISEKFCFTFDAEGNLDLDDEYDFLKVTKRSASRYEIKVTNLPENTTITSIKKIDANTNKVLAGAKLRLVDSNGKVIDEWTTTEESHVINSLNIGTYYLEEIEAPEGYSINKTKKEIKITSNSQAQEIEFKNNPLVKVPNTLITASKVFTICGIIGILAGISLLYFNAKKKEEV